MIDIGHIVGEQLTAEETVDREIVARSSIRWAMTIPRAHSHIHLGAVTHSYNQMAHPFTISAVQGVYACLSPPSSPPLGVSVTVLFAYFLQPNGSALAC